MIRYFLFFLITCSFTKAAEVGEFDLPDILPLSRPALRELRRLTADDPEAKALAAELSRQAEPLLGQPATPLEVIHYEGLVNTDPRRIQTVKRLKQTGEAVFIFRHWQASSSPQAKQTLMAWIQEWFLTYRITGNDVNENKLFPLLVAYRSFRPDYPPETRIALDAFVEELGRQHAEQVKKAKRFTNRYTKHVRLTAICGMILDREEWQATAYEGIKRFVSESLYGDGTSHDLNVRDTLTYHNSALRPPIQLAILAGDKGPALYHWTNERGGSLAKSVRYVFPYAMGEKQRREWTNSKIGLDRRRAEAGLEGYQPGSFYDPQQALELMELAAYFDPELMKAVHHLSEGNAKRFPTWQTLLNASVQAAHETPKSHPHIRP